MGTWGTGVSDNDTFCEVQDMLRQLIINEGVSPEVASMRILQSHDIDIPNVHYAIADSLWHCGLISEYWLCIVDELIEKDSENWQADGADIKMIQQRKRKMAAFQRRLHRTPSISELWHRESTSSVVLPQKGDVFWYRKKKNIYSSIVLDHNALGYYLVGISEKLQCIPIDVQTVLESSLYTVAWFDELSILKPSYRHNIGNVEINGNYDNRCGLYIGNDGSFSCKNVGQSKTWTHEYRSFNLPDRRLSALLDPLSLPKTQYRVF